MQLLLFSWPKPEPADRDKAHAWADAEHREALAQASEERQKLAAEQTSQIADLPSQNTELTKLTNDPAQTMKKLTAQIDDKLGDRVTQ